MGGVHYKLGTFLSFAPKYPAASTLWVRGDCVSMHLTHQSGRLLHGYKHPGALKGLHARRNSRLASASSGPGSGNPLSNGRAKKKIGEGAKITNVKSAGGGQTKKSRGGRDQKEFENKIRYMVPLNFVELFEAEWRVRELGMKKVDGFKELNIAREGSDYVVTSSWKSIPAWEAWSCSTVARRSHLPHGIFQYVPNKGEGFPDDFVPFKDMVMSVNPKY